MRREIKGKPGTGTRGERKAWIAVWLRGWDFLINVLTLPHNDWLAAWLSSRLTQRQAHWLARSLADCHRWRMGVYSHFRFGGGGGTRTRRKSETIGKKTKNNPGWHKSGRLRAERKNKKSGVGRRRETRRRGRAVSQEIKRDTEGREEAR